MATKTTVFGVALYCSVLYYNVLFKTSSLCLRTNTGDDIVSEPSGAAACWSAACWSAAKHVLQASLCPSCQNLPAETRQDLHQTKGSVFEKYRMASGSDPYCGYDQSPKQSFGKHTVYLHFHIFVTIHMAF